MDDLYANAWSDRQEIALPELKSPVIDSNPSWVSPNHSLPPHDEEADLAAPSWSTGAEIHWNEPSESSGFSWSQTDPDLAWGASTYEGIQIRNTPTEENNELSLPTPEPEEETTVASTPHSPHASTLEDTSLSQPSPDLTEALASVVHSPGFSSSPRSTSPDAFGTFETAATADDDPAFALRQNELEADTWGSAWNAPKVNEESTDGAMDEWEVAKQQKAKQDRKVPPEVLSAILQQCEEFSHDAWPETENKNMGSGKDNWKNDWRSGMEGVEGLNPFLEDFLPPLMLQRPAQFGKTAIAKRMATSVRLTKHLAITRASPMSHYMAAKGSTAWEIAVKERKDVVEDDVPLGWRILEKEPSQVSPVDANKGKKSSGRLFSFWGRREPTPSHSRSASAEGKDMLSERSKSPAMGSHSRQASQDSAKAPVRTSIDKGISPIHATSSTLPSPLASSPAVSAPAAPSISPAPLLQLSSYADAPEPQVDPTQVPPATAPSAVSRFLNRFSRRRSALGSGNPRSSLALSSDDLEFLSDIVPSANDDPEDDQDLTMKSLVSLVEPGPLPPILPPPPPAPPRVPSVSPTGAPGNAVQSGHNTMDSFDSFFGSLDVGPSTSEPAIPPSSSGGPSLRPLIASPLKPSRPSTPAATEVPVPSKRDTRPPSPSLLAFPGPANKQPSQPFFLPSPPSSRSQTPVSVTNTSISQLPVPSPHPLPALKSENRPTSMPSRLSRPRIPSPFIIPPPPSSQGRSHSNVPSSASTSSPSSDSANHSPGSPTSGLPLAELYPMAYRAKQPTQSAPGPPSASCRSQTPIPILAAPPPPPSRASSSSRPPSGPLDAFADDDFASFDTFAVPPTKPSLQIPPPLPPPTSRSQTPAILPPPPSSRSHSSASALAPPPLSSLPSNLRQNPIITIPSRRVDLFDDDDFTEFHSSSTSFFRPSPVQSFDSPSFDDSFTSEQSFLTPGKTQGFDVADFSPVLRTPSPPRPLSKTLSAAPPTLSTKHTEQSQPELTGGTSSLLLARRNRAAQQHQHTLSLVERAAARPGRWPAPPSPLPQAIPSPPSVRSSGSAAFVDLMEDDASSRSHSVGLPGSLSSPALLNPVRSTQAPHGLGIGNVPRLPPSSSSSQNSNAFGSGQHPTSSAGDSTWNVFNTGPPTTGPSMASTQGSGKSGGLSAQDLLFFEGL